MTRQKDVESGDSFVAGIHLEVVSLTAPASPHLSPHAIAPHSNIRGLWPRKVG